MRIMHNCRENLSLLISIRMFYLKDNKKFIILEINKQEHIMSVLSRAMEKIVIARQEEADRFVDAYLRNRGFQIHIDDDMNLNKD